MNPFHELLYAHFVRDLLLDKLVDRLTVGSADADKTVLHIAVEYPLLSLLKLLHHRSD